MKKHVCTFAVIRRAPPSFVDKGGEGAISIMHGCISHIDMHQLDVVHSMENETVANI